MVERRPSWSSYRAAPVAKTCRFCDGGAAAANAEDVPDHLLAHLTQLGWEHINLTGDYVWSTANERTEKP